MKVPALQKELQARGLFRGKAGKKGDMVYALSEWCREQVALDEAPSAAMVASVSPMRGPAKVIAEEIPVSAVDILAAATAFVPLKAPLKENFTSENISPEERNWSAARKLQLNGSVILEVD